MWLLIYQHHDVIIILPNQYWGYLHKLKNEGYFDELVYDLLGLYIPTKFCFWLYGKPIQKIKCECAISRLAPIASFINSYNYNQAL